VTTPDYVPIACDLYSELEVLADRRAEVVAESETAAGALERVRGRLLDLVTRDGAEYLLLGREQAESLSLRLDRLRSLARPDGTLLWRQDPGACETASTNN
jgi:transcriptional antiterminator Rof (Rho-off)